jgi:hypothetical protein
MDASSYKISSGMFVGLAEVCQRGLEGQQQYVDKGSFEHTHWDYSVCVCGGGGVLNIIFGYAKFNCDVLVNSYLTYIEGSSVICSFHP